jgi:DNA polymerase type B, organellar and viral
MKATIKNLLIIITFIVIYLTIDSDITNILYLTTPIISKKFNLKGDLNKDKLYHNLYEFFRKSKDQFVKILVKITIKDSNSRNRVITLTKFAFVNCENKNDILSVLTYTISKFRKYMDHYHPISINGLFVDYMSIDEKEYSTLNISNPWVMKKVDLNTFSFPLTTEYEKLAETIDTSDILYTEYKDCKGFKDSKNAEFRVSTTVKNDKLVVYAIQLSLNKELYHFNDVLYKETGELTRKFLDGTVVSNEGFKIEKIDNQNKITPRQRGILTQFNCITLDCETYLDVGLTQHLMSIATFDGSKSKFYFIADYNSELSLVEAVLNDLLRYDKINIYIHNGIKFDLIFLFKHIVSLKNKLNLQFNVTYKDGELLNIKISNGRNSIEIKDSNKLLLSKLSDLATVFNVGSPKGVFPFDFAKPENFNYVGKTPQFGFYTFNNKPLITINEYNKIITNNWSFRTELAKYNIQDCIILYEVMIKYNELIQNQFKVDIKNNPTLSSLAFYLYTSNYIPDNLLISNSETIQTKTGKISYKLSSSIQILSGFIEDFVR